MSCFLITTYLVFSFHILHVKYGIKRPNSLYSFFIILASDTDNLSVALSSPSSECGTLSDVFVPVRSSRPKSHTLLTACSRSHH